MEIWPKNCKVIVHSLSFHFFDSRKYDRITPFDVLLLMKLMQRYSESVHTELILIATVHTGKC